METKILKAEIKNFRNISTLVLTPYGKDLAIEGDNGNGKTNVLNAVMLGLSAGSTFNQLKKEIGGRIIKEGAEASELTFDLGDYVVTNKIKAGDKPSVTIKHKDGKTIRKGVEAFLSQLVDVKKAANPALYSILPKEKQEELFLKLAGLDFTKIDAKIAEVFEARADVSRDLKIMEAQFSGLEFDPAWPDKPTSMQELLKKQNEYQKFLSDKKNREHEKERSGELIKDLERLVDDATKTLRQAEENLLVQTEALYQAKREHSKIVNTPELTWEEEDPAIALNAIEETNKNAAQKQAYKIQSDKVCQVRENFGHWDEEVTNTRLEKRDMVKKAKFPVDGMSYDIEKSCVTYKGKPISELSRDQSRIFGAEVACVMAQGASFMLVDNADTMDNAHIEAIKKIGEKYNIQIIIVQTRDLGTGFNTIKIEEGGIK